jgi:hypothetical protein
MLLGMRIAMILGCIVLPLHVMKIAGAQAPVGIQIDGQQILANGQGHLDISGQQLTDDSLREIQIPEGVTSIDLSNNNLTTFPVELIQRLPLTVESVNLSHNVIHAVGEDFTIAQRGLRISVARNQLKLADQELLRTRISRPNFIYSFVEGTKKYIETPFATFSKIVGGMAALACYGLLNRRFATTRPLMPRIGKIVQNGLYAYCATHALWRASEKSPELALGSVGLLACTGPIITLDTLALAYGKAGIQDGMQSKVAGAYMHALTAGMRAFGALYVARQCLLWGKAKIVRVCDAYLNRKKNLLITTD